MVGKDHTDWFHDELGKNYMYEKELEEFSKVVTGTLVLLYIYTKINKNGLGIAMHQQY